jgi:hypothetical protein
MKSCGLGNWIWEQFGNIAPSSRGLLTGLGDFSRIDKLISICDTDGNGDARNAQATLKQCAFLPKKHLQ